MHSHVLLQKQGQHHPLLLLKQPGCILNMSQLMLALASTGVGTCMTCPRGDSQILCRATLTHVVHPAAHHDRSGDRKQQQGKASWQCLMLLPRKSLALHITLSFVSYCQTSSLSMP